LNVLDLFSGIGGFSLGLEAAGMRTAAFCEIDPFCRAILRQHWPETPIYHDIKTLGGGQYHGTIDLICGGYPCQPFSMAGRRRGAEDERHLWPQMHRLIREIRPRWVIAENVAGHINLGFDEVAASLEAEGFAVWPFIIPACAVGAHHRRDRLWIVANARRGRCRKTRKYCAGTEEWIACSSEDVADAHNRDAQGVEPRRDDAIVGQKQIERPSGLRNGTGPDGYWTIEPDVGRVAHGIPNRAHRLKALGNAIVPQIAHIIGEAIMKFEASL
jgi:DNA (cytosine-5)-methyltransferase 1